MYRTPMPGTWVRVHETASSGAIPLVRVPGNVDAGKGKGKGQGKGANTACCRPRTRRVQAGGSGAPLGRLGWLGWQASESLISNTDMLRS